MSADAVSRAEFELGRCRCAPDSASQIDESARRQQARMDKLVRAQQRQDDQMQLRYASLARGQRRLARGQRSLTARIDEVTASMGVLTTAVEAMVERFDSTMTSMDTLRGPAIPTRTIPAPVQNEFCTTGLPPSGR